MMEVVSGGRNSAGGASAFAPLVESSVLYLSKDLTASKTVDRLFAYSQLLTSRDE